MKALSLFSGAGIGESRIEELGIEVIGANELHSDRAELFSKINPRTPIVQGDIRDQNIKQQIYKHAESGFELLIATPPCQGVSIAGKNRSLLDQSADIRNYLIFDVIEIIKQTNPNFVLIENVPQYLTLLLPFQDKWLTVVEILSAEFGNKYEVDYEILNSQDFAVPQNRNRAFIRLTKKTYSWKFPSINNKIYTLEQTISHLPSLEAGQKSGIEWHFARTHLQKHIEWMRHTPTGSTAFDNQKYFPQKEDGSPIKAYRTTYRRMSWDKPATAITMRNDAISSQCNVHPGRQLGDGTYSDARVLTPHELLLINSMDTKRFAGIQTTERLLRKVLGEGVPPLLLNAALSGIKR